MVKRLLMTLTMVSLFGVVLFAAIPFTDSFTRSDGGLGGNYTAMTSPNILTISSNTVIASNEDFVCSQNNSAVDAFSADQSMQVTIAAFDSADSVGVGVRGSGDVSAGTWSAYFISTDGTSIDKVVSGSGSSLTSFPGTTWTVGDTMKLSIQGSTLSFYKNGVLLGTTSDGTITTGQPMACIFDSSANGLANTALDDWASDNVSAGGGSPVRHLLSLLGVGKE